MKYDKRWHTKSELPQYLAMFFLVYQKDIIDAGLKWKDCIYKVIQKREEGEKVYNSLFIPENNV